MNKHVSSYLSKTTSAAPLAVLRIGFGIMMFFSIIRFWAKGWIEKIYIEPLFHFKYFGFEWIPDLGSYVYVLFALCGLSALMIAIGYLYRLASILFFISFTYIELLEKTTYLNHYYFISILSLILIFLPAQRRFSMDALRVNYPYQVPKWTVDILKLLIGIVYFYAGLAKINSDWLLRAMPLKIWLPSKYDLPLIGDNLMQQNWFHYAMSWSGMIYDIAIPFLLLYRRTRNAAFVLVVIFHVFTRVLFPIGMFPYIMIIGALIFLSPEFHERILRVMKNVSSFMSNIFSLKAKVYSRTDTIKTASPVFTAENMQVWTVPLLAFLMIFQLLFPFRYAFYEDVLFWTEEGYRFSWRVMLMEKVGYVTFKVVDTKKGSFFNVDNTDFLTSYQEKQMSFQPDFILEYAHYLEQHFKSQGHEDIAIYADSYVSLNGRKSQRFVDPSVDLTQIEENFSHKTWILPFNGTIKGL